MTPPLPSLRALTRELRALHEAWSHPDAGGEYAALVCAHAGGTPPSFEWRVYAFGMAAALWLHPETDVFGREHIPGDGAPFDAVAAARRLLAAARDGGAS